MPHTPCSTGDRIFPWSPTLLLSNLCLTSSQFSSSCHVAHVQETQGGCARRSGMGRGDALDVASVHRSLGVVANPPASSQRLPFYGSCNRPPAHAPVASGITASLWFQVILASHFCNKIVVLLCTRHFAVGFRV